MFSFGTPVFHVNVPEVLNTWYVYPSPGVVTVPPLPFGSVTELLAVLYGLDPFALFART
jgi:hypothetical protein